MRRWMALLLAPLIMLGALIVLLILTTMTATSTAATIPSPDAVMTDATTVNCAITTAIDAQAIAPITHMMPTQAVAILLPAGVTAQTQKIDDGTSTAAQTSRRCVLKIPHLIAA